MRNSKASDGSSPGPGLPVECLYWQEKGRMREYLAPQNQKLRVDRAR